MALWKEASEAFCRVNLSHLADKRLNSREPINCWLYRYVTIRISIGLLLLYVALLTRYDMIGCETKSGLRRDVTDRICLFGSTYIVRSTLLELEQIYGPQNRSLFSTAINSLKSDGKRENQSYYVHSLLILLLLVCHIVL